MITVRRGAALMACWIAACQGAGREGAAARDRLGEGTPLSPVECAVVLGMSPLGPLPASPTNAVADDPAAARLGQALYFDVRLSANGAVSCATCHDPAKGFADPKALSDGVGQTTRNSPALWNVAYNRWLFWDGRADSLWSQCLKPVEAPNEMGGTRAGVARLIGGDKQLRAAYEGVFGALVVGPDWPPSARPALPGEDPLPPSVAEWELLPEPTRSAIDQVFANFGKAIEAYERRLVSRDAPFDRFVHGLRSGDEAELRALSAAAQRGLSTFVGRGRCILCHTGPNLTDGEFHNIGLEPAAGSPLDVGRFAAVPIVKADRFNGAGRFSDAPAGAHNDYLRYVAQKPNNLGEFKTPSLRNVATTAPYMHDGRFPTLEAVLRFYSTLAGVAAIGHREETLLPLALTDPEIRDLVEFLGSLTGAPLAPALVAPVPPPAAPAATTR